MPSAGCEQPHREALAEARREQVFSPRADLRQWARDLAGEHRRPESVEPKAVHVVVGLGPGEVISERSSIAGGGQRDVLAQFGIAQGQPADVEDDDPPQLLEDLNGPFLDGADEAASCANSSRNPWEVRSLLIAPPGRPHLAMTPSLPMNGSAIRRPWCGCCCRAAIGRATDSRSTAMEIGISADSPAWLPAVGWKGRPGVDESTLWAALQDGGAPHGTWISRRFHHCSAEGSGWSP